MFKIPATGSKLGSYTVCEKARVIHPILNLGTEDKPNMSKVSAIQCVIEGGQNRKFVAYSLEGNPILIPKDGTFEIRPQVAKAEAGEVFYVLRVDPKNADKIRDTVKKLVSSGQVLEFGLRGRGGSIEEPIK